MFNTIKIISQTHSNDLPQESENEMLLSLDEIVSVDVDDVAADRLSGVQGQRQVLDLGVDRVGLLVERALVDGVRTRVVDHFAEGKNGVVELRLIVTIKNA